MIYVALAATALVAAVFTGCCAYNRGKRVGSHNARQECEREHRRDTIHFLRKYGTFPLLRTYCEQHGIRVYDVYRPDKGA